MQLNPARGRKHDKDTIANVALAGMVYAAQPREGTETKNLKKLIGGRLGSRFMQLNPARGRKPEGCLRGK